ncbi:hypothetical protein C8034_v002027 [Colletotrichum sidae]|uniref:Uncharacterized protein n=1 Tax=Colletotrichum sidae TaxID=1347389 RepID=A0A4R8TC19_9PEZI|nr:hypothetical protein C8034_v002027 [Colletotrichum sidae]
MCRQQQPISRCRRCGDRSYYRKTPYPCAYVDANRLPLGGCGRITRYATYGPDDYMCETCVGREEWRRTAHSRKTPAPLPARQQPLPPRAVPPDASSHSSISELELERSREHDVKPRSKLSSYRRAGRKGSPPPRNPLAPGAPDTQVAKTSPPKKVKFDDNKVSIRSTLPQNVSQSVPRTLIKRTDAFAGPSNNDSANRHSTVREVQRHGHMKDVREESRTSRRVARETPFMSGALQTPGPSTSVPRVGELPNFHLDNFDEEFFEDYERSRQSDTPEDPAYDGENEDSQLEEQDRDEAAAPQTNPPGGARLSAGYAASNNSLFKSFLSSSSDSGTTDSSAQHLALPTDPDTPFGFGRSPRPRVPVNSPATQTFIANFLQLPVDQLPPHPGGGSDLDEDGWIPGSWGDAHTMPAELAHSLNYMAADSIFRKHRVYFVAERGEADGCVLVVTPDGLHVRVLSIKVYMATVKDVNRTERERHVADMKHLQEVHRRERLEAQKSKKGICIFHPCRVADCPRAHADGQHQPMGHEQFLKTQRRRELPGLSKLRAPAAGLGNVKDDVFGSGAEVADHESEERGRDEESGFEQFDKEKQGDEKEEGDDVKAEVNPATEGEEDDAKDDEKDHDEEKGKTPETIKVKPAVQRQPKHFVERDAKFRMSPVRDLTRTSTGSPPQRKKTQDTKSAVESSSKDIEEQDQASEGSLADDELTLDPLRIRGMDDFETY